MSQRFSFFRPVRSANTSDESVTLPSSNRFMLRSSFSRLVRPVNMFRLKLVILLSCRSNSVTPLSPAKSPALRAVIFEVTRELPPSVAGLTFNSPVIPARWVSVTSAQSLTPLISPRMAAWTCEVRPQMPVVGVGVGVGVGVFYCWACAVDCHTIAELNARIATTMAVAPVVPIRFAIVLSFLLAVFVID